MPTNTYVALDKVTVGIATPSITFTSISQAYTDLVVVVSSTSTRSLFYRVGNGSVDSDSKYSRTQLIGDGSSATSSRAPNENKAYMSLTTSGGVVYQTITQLNNYSNTTTYKTFLTRYNDAAVYTAALVSLWRSTAAINIITITGDGGDIPAGSTFSLYGIAAQVTPGTAKATGGTITYDDFGRVIHTFTSSGTFTPSVALTNVDYLVVAGGGGGGSAGSNSVRGAGGGGAGGYRTFTSQSISTAQTITIGAGGAGAPASSRATGTNGTNSSMGSSAATGGGAGSAEFLTAGNGGSGGGAGDGGTRGTGNAGSYSPVEGYAGGLPGGGAVNDGAGGGGSAAVGSNGSSLGSGGAGGDGTSDLISGTAITYAVGGNGGSYNSGATGATGTANRGNGGGGAAGSSGGFVAGGSGGSGIVIIRYQG